MSVARKSANLAIMDRFSFVLVLLSIIVGLGVTELLTSVARQIQSRRTTTFYWLQSLLVAMVFVALLQQWWESWDQRVVETWSFPVLLLMLGGPVSLYLIAHLLFPREVEGADLKAYYFENCRATYLLAVLAVISSTLYRPLSFDHSLMDTDNLTSLILVFLFAALAVWRKPTAHAIIVPLAFILAFADVLIFHWAI